MAVALGGLSEVPLRDAVRLLNPKVFALVTTLDAEGRVDAAPFAFVYPISIDPPLVCLGITKGKLTVKNILERREFVINVVSAGFAQKAVFCEEKSGEPWKRLERTGLQTEASKMVRVPRVKESRAVLECIFHELLEPREGDHALVVGRVVRAECAFMKGGVPDLDRLDYLMHAFGGEFRRVGGEVALERRK